MLFRMLLSIVFLLYNINLYCQDSPPPGYSLVWSDEFNEGSSPKKGSVKRQDGWLYQTGNDGWGNGELQNYVNGDENPENCFLADGLLNIVLTESLKDDGTSEYRSIRMLTVKRWQYGYFEARIKLPVGSGTWPAFWMMPFAGAWPDYGEIDIMEEVGNNPQQVRATVHTKSYRTGIGRNYYLPTANSEFHIYAMEWTEDKLEFFVDGDSYFIYNVNDDFGIYPFNMAGKYYIILNLAFGGSWGGYGGVDYDCMPSTMQIDYVRVYQKTADNILESNIERDFPMPVYGEDGVRLNGNKSGLKIANGKKYLNIDLRLR